MARAVCLLLCASVILTSAVQYYDPGRFYFVKPPGFMRRSADECSTCYGDECFEMNHARCELYSSTSELLYGGKNNIEPNVQPSNSSIKNQVDSLLMDFIEEASEPSIFQECYPLISEYTDCNKENVCIGCKTCSCDMDGFWNCTIVHNCREEEPLNVDHAILVAAIEALKDNDDNKPSSRKKRWVFESFNNSITKPHKLSYEEISEWMYGVKPLNFGNNGHKTTEAPKTDGATISTNVQGLTTPKYTETRTDSDYLAFDEVLNNISVQGKTYNRRRPLNLTDHIEIDHDDVNNINYENVNATLDHVNSLAVADHFIDILNAIEEQNDLESTTDTTTEFVFDLLEVARKKIGVTTPASFNETDSKENKNDSLYQLKNASLEENNDLTDFNIMKRDVSEAVKLNASANNSSRSTTSTPISNETQVNDLIKTSMNLALDQIIQSKENELNSLMFVRNKITEYLQGTIRHTKKINFNDTSINGNINNAYFSFYNIDINADVAPEYKRHNKELKSTHYLEKLKSDVLVVVRDLTVLQRLIGFKNFPQHLKNLVRALKYYIRNTNETYSDLEKKMLEGKEMLNTRRHWIYPYPANKELVRRYITEILQAVDKDMPQSDALDPLSPKSKEILKRILIKQNILKNPFNFSQSDDPRYNLAENLKRIGLKSTLMTRITMTAKPQDKLYHLKTLQLLVLSDIAKITDSMTKLDFFSNRRLIRLRDPKSEKQLKRINNDLRTIQNKIKTILNFRIETKKAPKKRNVIHGRAKKDNMVKHLRNLLRNSKKDIVELLRRKVPKTEIVKSLAKKKLIELSKAKMMNYRSVMKKWQENLNVKRKKRSAITFKDIKNRIKNILPKYLRGKVHSGMRNSTKHKNKRSKPRKKNHSRRNQTKAENSKTTVKTTTLTTEKYNRTNIISK